MESTEYFQKSIASMLDNEAAKDPIFAETLKKEGKNIEECCDYIIGEVEKSGKCGFADEEILGMAITDVDTLIEEGETMHHCAATYYDKPDSLIFSVRDSECKRIATVEWSLSEGRILQCRGKYNSVPEMYDEIVSLINNNSGRIRCIV